MRQTRLFLSRFALSLCILLLGSFVFLLLFEARKGGVSMPIAGVAIKAESAAAVPLPNRIFTCTETEQQSQCEADIQGRLLRLVLVPDQTPGSGLSDCQAQYDGQPISCQSKGLDYAPMLSESFEVSNLGLISQQLQAVRQKYWGISTLLKLGEPRLIRISTGLSIAAGAIAAYFAWFHPSWLSKGLASIAWGFVVCQLAWGFLGSVPFDAVTPYGFTIESWSWAVDSGAKAIGIAATLAIALLLRQRRITTPTKAIVTVSSGFGTFFMTGYILLLTLLGSGFAD